MEQEIKTKKKRNITFKDNGTPCWDCQRVNKPNRRTCIKCEVDL